MKITSLSYHRAFFTRRLSVLCTCVRGVLCTSLAYLSRTFRLSPATCGPPKMVRTSLILSGLRCHGHSFATETWGSLSKNSLKCPIPFNLSILYLRALHFTVIPNIFVIRTVFPDNFLRLITPYVSSFLNKFLFVTA